MDTRELIVPILRETYGKSSTIEAMADDVAAHIDDGASERDILNRCWMWMSGGSTAESVARKIMDARASTGEETEA